MHVGDVGVGSDAGESEPEPRPYDPTGQEVGFTLALGDLDPIWPIPEPATNPEFGGQVGRGFGIDDVDGDRPFRRVLASFSMHDDIAAAPQLNGVVSSTDGARTFGELRAGIEEPPTFAIELRDGRVLSYGFVPTARREVGEETELTLDGSESLDRGLTWRDFSATVTVPRMAPGLGRVSGHPTQLADGTILLPYYLAHAGDRGTRAELLESTDGGATFVRRASIAVPGVAGVSYPEPDLVKLADGTLYSVFRHHSFENDPAGAPPRGYVETASAWVTDYDAGDTRRALRLVDSSDSVIAHATWIGTPRADKHLAFSVRPVELPGGFLFSIRGRDGAGEVVTAYHFAVMPDCSLARYDFTATTWTPLTGAGRVPLDVYTRIRVEADLEGATLFVDDERIERVAPSESGAVVIDSHAFSSSGTRPTGDHVLVDDVYFQ